MRTVHSTDSIATPVPPKQNGSNFYKVNWRIFKFPYCGKDLLSEKYLTWFLKLLQFREKQEHDRENRR